MPYKKKEDRTEAVRRHRDKKKKNEALTEKAAKIDASLGSLLRLIGFEEMPFDYLVESCKEIEKDHEGVWHDRKSGKVTYPPSQVFFGLNTMIAGNHLYDQLHALAVLFQDILDYEENCDPEG